MTNFNVSDQAFNLWWIAEDRQHSLPMGEFGSLADAEAAIPAAKDALLAQCGDDAQREDIEAGFFSIDAPSEGAGQASGD